VPSTAVIQVKQGIGDVIWHLPFIRAIAGQTPEGAVTFLTLPSTRARDLLAAEPAVHDVAYFEHKGSELQRGLNLVKLVALMRARRFKSIWILDKTVRPALAARLAGIPQRIGLGLGSQRYFITNPGIDQRHFHDMPIEWLTELMHVLGVPFESTEPDLRLPPAALQRVSERFGATPRPWIAIALGGSHPQKDWPDAHWAAFVDTLRRRTAGTVFFVGGPDNTVRAQAFIEHTTGAPAVNACDLSIIDAAALLRLVDLFVGPDSGPMNLAAAGQTPAFGLFGSTPLLSYSRFIHVIEPDDGSRGPDGMTRISPASVMARIEPYLQMKKT